MRPSGARIFKLCVWEGHFLCSPLLYSNYNNEILIATYIDAMEAFVTVNHQILLEKAKEYVITGQALVLKRQISVYIS